MTTLTRPQIHWLTFVLWLIAQVLGFGLVGAMFHNFPLAFTLPPDLVHLGRFSLRPALLGFFFGFIPALLIGFLQWVMLRPLLRLHRPLSRWWMVSVSVGVGLMHFLSDGFENARDLSVAVILGGLVVGAFQGRLLPSPAGSWSWWVSGLAWYGGWLLGIAILHTTGLYRPWDPSLTGITHGVLGLTVGLTAGLSTLLAWRSRPPTTGR